VSLRRRGRDDTGEPLSPSRPPGSVYRVDSIRRNAAFLLAVQLTSSAFTAVLMLFLVRALGPGRYGLFSLALAVGALAVLPSDFGISPATARFIAEHRGDRAAIARLMANSLRLKLAVGAVVSTALFLGAHLIASAYGNTALTWPLRGIAVSVFGESLMGLLIVSFVAQGTVSSNLRLVFSESAIELVASIGLVLLGAGATGAAFGRAVGYFFGAAVGLVLMVRVLGRTAVDVRRSEHGRTRRLVTYAGSLAVVDSAWTLFAKVDSILIGAIINARSVALFDAPMRLISFLQYPASAIAGGVAPTLARADRERAPDPGAFTAALRYALILQAALIAPFLVWADPITHLLFGTGYERSADVLRALTPYVFLAGAAPVVSISATYLGEARRRIPVVLAADATNVLLDLMLLPRIGVVGAAVGSDAGFLLYVPAHLLICRRKLGFSLRPLVLTTLRVLTAAAAMAAILAAVGTELTPALWVIGAAGGTAGFVATLLVTRELSLGELRAAWHAVRVRLRRPRRSEPTGAGLGRPS